MSKLNCALWLRHAKCCWRTKSVFSWNRYFCLSDLGLSRVGLYKHSVGLLHKFLANRQDLPRIPTTSFTRACRLYSPFVVPREWTVGGKNFSSLSLSCWSPYVRYEGVWGSVLIAPPILKLGTKCWWVVAIGRGRPTHGVRATGTRLIGGWMSPLQSQSGRFGKKRNLLSLTGFEHRIVHPRHWLRHPGVSSLSFSALHRCFLNCVMSVSLERWKEAVATYFNP